MSYVFQDIICLWEVKSFFVFSYYDEKNGLANFLMANVSQKWINLAVTRGKDGKCQIYIQ